jgi:type III secretion protein W
MSPLNPQSHSGNAVGLPGQWNALPGAGVQIGETQRSLTDAAEEMSWAVAEDVEDRTLEERALSEYEAPDVPEPGDVEALLRMMRDEEGGREVFEFSTRLVALSRDGVDLRLATRRWSGEGGRQNGYSAEMKQYAALSVALRKAETSGEGPRVVESLRDAVEGCMRDHGPQIRAGINTAEQAAMFGSGRTNVDRFRATYQDAVLGQESLAATLQLVLERFGEDVQRGIELLRKALGADMAALHPSREPERLHAVLQDLYQLATAASVLQRCHEIVRRLQQYMLLRELQPLALMQDLVSWTIEPWIMGYHVTLLLEGYCPADDEAHPEYGRSGDERDENGDGDGEGHGSDEDDPETTRIVLLNGALSVIRDLPPKVFASDEHRLQAMDAIQQVLDAMLLPEE